MSDLTTGRARRMLSVGGLTTAVGGSYLWQALKRPFRSASSAQQALLETHVRNAQKLVLRSQELRGAFMKLSQMLSMRSDLFPAEALEVLSVVQSSVPAMPWSQVRSVLQDDLGDVPEALFRDIDPTAFAAASLGQVHRATLHGGAAVVVKVQYPGVADTVRQDVGNVRALVRVFTAIARDVMGQHVDADEIVGELETGLAEELDYRREAANARRFRALLASDREVVVPRVHDELSGGRVLTMSFVDGYSIQDVMAPGVDQALKDWVAVKLFRLLWRQVLDFGVLHTDPHPGNYLVTHHPRLGLLDFGAVRVFEPAVRHGYLRLARAILAADDIAIGDAAAALGFVDGDPAPVTAILRIVCEPLLEDRPWDPRAYDVMERGMRIAQIELAHKAWRAPGHHVFLVRALAGMDGYLKAFGTVRNWRRLFCEIVDAVPDDERSSA